MASCPPHEPHPRAVILQPAIEDGVVADSPNICCTGDDDSGVCAVAGS